jgi:dihydropteroate synthase
VITLAALAALAADHAADLAAPIAPIVIGDRSFDADHEPVVMGAVNLSRDSTYRESIAVSAHDAIVKARVMAAQGAHVVDVGAESSTAKAARVDPGGQLAQLLPVIEGLAEFGIPASVETYEASVAKAGLKAGASVVNLTGREQEREVFDAAAAMDATVILCYSAGANVREITDVTLEADPFPAMEEHFAARIETARAHGVDRLVLDPGMGFFYGNLVDPKTRARHQTMVLLSTFRLRRLGLPICHALPHAFDVFGDEFRTAEGFFAVLARLGGTSMLRTHEVARVVRVLDALQTLDVR